MDQHAFAAATLFAIEPLGKMTTRGGYGREARVPLASLTSSRGKPLATFDFVAFHILPVPPSLSAK